jgi:cell division protein FtsQ
VSVFGEWWHRSWRRLALGLFAVVLMASPWWARAVARRLAFFRVQRVEIVGVRFISPSEILRRLRVDTLTSVWDDLGTLERRVRLHPQVSDVTIERRLPGTLVVRIDENLPIALVPTNRGFRAYDGEGHALPLDPSRTAVDLPILTTPDPALLRLLALLRSERPNFFARINDVRRVDRDEVLLHLGSLPVRVMVDVTIDRLDEIAPVEEDLTKRQAHVAELDLRFRDQVIARLQ